MRVHSTESTYTDMRESEVERLRAALRARDAIILRLTDDLADAARTLREAEIERARSVAELAPVVDEMVERLASQPPARRLRSVR